MKVRSLPRIIAFISDLSFVEYIGESASAAFHWKVREYVQSQHPEARLRTRFPEPHNPNDPIDLVNPDEPPDHNISNPSHHTSPSHHPHLTSPIIGVDPLGSPASPLSNFSVNTLRSRLPPRHLADPLIDRFFKQVHSIFWVFPPDVFRRRLENTYAAYDVEMYGEGTECTFEQEEGNGREIERASWMCCLFTVLALGSSTSEDNELLKPWDFFELAKGLSRVLVEDESIQSIQALLLMVAPPLLFLGVAWSVDESEFVPRKHRLTESWLDLSWRCNSFSTVIGSASE